MMPWIRHLAGSGLLMMTLIAGGLALYFAAPGAQMPPVLHPVACHGCSGNAPPEVVAAYDAELARIGAIEAACPSDTP
jgi:hypothetical protein